MILSAGCWSSIEIEDLALVTAVGIDYEDDGYILSILIVQPENISSQGGKEGSSTTLLTSRGATIFDAVRNALLSSSRKMYWGYCEIAILGKETLDKGLVALTDFMIRDYEVRPITWITVAEEKASDLLNAKIFLSPIFGEGSNSLFETQRSLSKCNQSMLRQVITSLSNEGIDFSCTELGTTDIGDEKFIAIKGTALFQRDNYKGSIDTLTSRGLLWLMGKVEGGIIVLKNLETDIMALEIVSSSSKIKPRVKDGALSFEITIDVLSSIGEEPGFLNVTKPEIWETIIEQQGNHVKQEAEKALSIIKEMGVDPVGFGKIVHALYPRTWQQLRDDWPNHLKNLPVSITVKSRLRNSGTILSGFRSSKKLDKTL